MQPAAVQIRFKNVGISSNASSGMKISHPILLIDGINLSTSPTSLQAFDDDLQFGDDKKNKKTRYIIDMFTKLGYTPILVQFGNTTQKSTKDNATIFSALLKFLATTNMFQWDNANAEKFQMVGFSQGGVIGRYGAYLYDKDRGSLPGVRLLLTFDSPHQGAVLPRGLLATIDFWANNGGGDAAKTYLEMLKNAGVNDLLIYDTKNTDFNPDVTSNRWLFNEYRNAATYKGFPTVMISDGLLQGKSNKSANTDYYNLNRWAEKGGSSWGRASSVISYSTTPTGIYSENHVYAYLDKDIPEAKYGESKWDLVQGSSYPFPKTLFNLFEPAFKKQIPDNFSEGWAIFSLDFHGKWESDNLNTPSTSFIPTVSALDMQCNGDIAVRDGCAFSQTEPTANDWEENPGTITTGKSIYAVDETHPDFAQAEGLYHVFGANPLDLWRMYCEVMKSDVENGTFENSTLNGKMDPAQSCMSQDLIPSWFRDEYKGALATSFPRIRWAYNASQNDKEDASFSVPAGWNKVAVFARNEEMVAGDVISVTLKVSDIGNWAKLDFVLLQSPSGTGWTQLGERSVTCDGEFYTYSWTVPSWVHSGSGYAWAYLVVNSSTEGNVQVQSVRIAHNSSASTPTEASQSMTQPQIYPGNNSEWTLGSWGNPNPNYSDGNGTGMDLNFSKYGDGILWYANTPLTSGTYSSLKVTYWGGTCTRTGIYFDQNTYLTAACAENPQCRGSGDSKKENFVLLGDPFAPKNTIQTATIQFLAINGWGTISPVHRLVFQALGAGQVDDCIIQSVQFQ